MRKFLSLLGSLFFILSAPAQASFSPSAWDHAQANTGNTTLTVNSATLQTINTTSGSVTLTLPSAAAVNGKVFAIKRITSTSNSAIVSRAGSDTIDGSTSVTFGAVVDQVIILQSDGTTRWKLLVNTASPNGGTSGQVQVSTGAAGVNVWGDITAITGGDNIAYTNSTNSFTASQIPNAVNTYDLGSTTKWWSKIYFGDDATNYTVIDAQPLTGNRTLNTPDANSTTVQAASGATGEAVTGINGTTGALTFDDFVQFGGNGTDGALTSCSGTKRLFNATTMSIGGAGPTVISCSSPVFMNCTSTYTDAATGVTQSVSSDGGIGGFAGTNTAPAGNGSGLGPGSGASAGNAIGGGGGASITSNGGNGGQAAGGVGRGGVSLNDSKRPIEGSGGGGGGGTTASAAPGIGGNGGGVFVICAKGAVSFSNASGGPNINASGGSGAAGTGTGANNSAGGGGGGGGAVFIYSQTSISTTAGGTHITVAGGNGGAGSATNASGGGGGAGGLFYNLSPSNTLNGTNTISGGSGGAKVGTGVAGTAGTTGLTLDNSGTPSLPIISLDLDLKEIKLSVALERLKRIVSLKDEDDSYFSFDEQSRISARAAVYCAPGKFYDLKVCQLGDYNPVSLCDKSLVGEHGENLSENSRIFLSNYHMEPPHPVCLVKDGDSLI